MTILLSHSGKQDDIEIAEKIGKKTGIDLIIGGHSHDLIEKPIIINNIPIIQAGFNGKYFAKLILTPNKQNKTIKDYKYEIIKTFTDKVQPDKKIQDIVNNLVSENKDLFKVVCKTTIPLDNETRTQETQFGNFVVDNLVDMYNSDLAFVHSKTIRRSIGGPEITVNALYEALPYLDKSELVLMKGYQIKKLIEYFLNTKPDRILCIPYTLSYKYKQRYNDKYYVTELNFKGQPIDYNQFYQVVATSHDINNFKKYYDAKPVKKLSDNTLQDLINYLEQLKLYKPYKFGRFEKINQ
jgi:5'-nucleotidase